MRARCALPHVSQHWPDRNSVFPGRKRIAGGPVLGYAASMAWHAVRQPSIVTTKVLDRVTPCGSAARDRIVLKNPESLIFNEEHPKIGVHLAPKSLKLSKPNPKTASYPELSVMKI